MVSTARLGLPLVQASQAQKHVTVNTAFERVDALSQLVLASSSVATPPASTSEGECFAVPVGAVNEWSGHEGQIAVFLNGGWDFVVPVQGWRAWVADEGLFAVFDGMNWTAGATAVSPNGAAFGHRVIEVDHTVQAGPSSSTTLIIPNGAIVYAVTGLVLSSIAGAATSFQLGILGQSPDRYGSGIGLSTGSWLRGVTSSPLAYYADTALSLTGEGGDFSGGGVVRLSVHVAEFSLPQP